MLQCLCSNEALFFCYTKKGVSIRYKVEVFLDESKDYISMYRVQAEKLQYNEEQEERSGQT